MEHRPVLHVMPVDEPVGRARHQAVSIEERCAGHTFFLLEIAAQIEFGIVRSPHDRVIDPRIVDLDPADDVAVFLMQRSQIMPAVNGEFPEGVLRFLPLQVVHQKIPARSQESDHVAYVFRFAGTAHGNFADHDVPCFLRYCY